MSRRARVLAIALTAALGSCALAVHGSDAGETAVKEIAQFFSGNEIVG